MSKSLSELRQHLGAIQDLERAARVLSWDQETYMPEQGAQPRAQQLATLERIAHEQFTSDKTGLLLDDLAETLIEESPLADALHRVTRRDYERARCLPADLVADFSEASSLAQQAWKKARAQDNFAAFAPHLKTLVDLSRRKADAFGFSHTPYNALLETYEPGMTTAQLSDLFGVLRTELVPLVDEISNAQTPETDFLRKNFDEQSQLDFGLQVARDFGYDLGRGRMDLSEHPFSTSFAITDVRITTRVSADDFSTAFFGTLHEAGHAIYEQGLASELERTPLADGASLGMHESQSRLWENLIGRSESFWKYYFPRVKKKFRSHFGQISLQDFLRGINRVKPSLIRVEADEVTYNLHVMLRFELERNLIEGSVSVDDLPEAWNEGIHSYLGLKPRNDAEGVLQDVHWSLGAFGYFPTYTIGNVMSVQIFKEAQEDIKNLEKQIQAGQFEDLLAWLRLHIHRHGRKKLASTILYDLTGQELSAEPWLQYVREKYYKLYAL